MDADAPPKVPHLDDGVISEILHRLPSKEAYRVSVVCRRWRAIAYEPGFLSSQLSPRPLPLLDDDGPFAVILQPRHKVRYTHLTLVPTNPEDTIDLHLPLDINYTDESWQRYLIRSPSCYDLDTEDDFTDNDFTDDEDGNDFLRDRKSLAVDEDEVRVADDGPEERDEPPRGSASDDVRHDNVDVAEELDIAVAEDVKADYVAFFERTVPMLDVSIAASHGRAAAAAATTSALCNPTANRWVALPPASFPATHDTARGLHYDYELDDAATGGRVSFTAVLLVRLPQRRVLVETFSSTTGRWDTKLIGAQGVARCLGGVASPGIYAGTSFYWLSQRPRRVVCYDVASRRASVLREPPEAERSEMMRMGRSLGSVSGRLRMCAFDILDKNKSMVPHDGIQGVHGVWVMDDGAWRRVHEAVVDNITVRASYFGMLFDYEPPVDFAGASGSSIIMNRAKFLFRYDLESGDKVQLASLYRDDGTLCELYRRFHGFAFFRSA